MKVSGFIRIAPIYPAPVVPIFLSDKSNAINLQIIGSDGTILGFGEAAGVPKERVFLKSHHSYPEAEVGEEAIFAIETAEKEVSLRRASKYEELLRRFLTDEWLEKSPFVAFEVAKGLKDRAALRKAAERCVTRLSSQSTKLAQRWISGSVDDLSLSQELADLIGSSIEAGDSDRLNLHYVAPQYILAIIDRAAARSKRSRASLIRNTFNPNMFDMPAVQAQMPLVCAALLQRCGASDAGEIPFVTWYRTKGKLPVSPSTFGLFRELESSSRSFSYRSKDFMLLSKLDVLEINRGSYTSFLFLCGIAQIDKKVIGDIEEIKAKDLIDKFTYLSVGRAIEATRRT